MKAAPILAALLVGCVDLDLDRVWVYDGPVNSCDDDGDCPQGTCRQDLGLCVAAPPPAETTYWVRVTPDGTGNTPPQAWPVALDSDGEFAAPIAVRRPVVVQGATLAGDSALHANVVFVDRGNRLPGRAAPRAVYRSTEKVFSLELLPSSYDIVVLPEGSQAAVFPPHYLDGVLLDETGRLVHPDSPEEGLDLILEEPGLQVTGRILQGGHPVNGLTVRAMDAAGFRAISTTGVTACVDQGGEAECGRFSFGLARGVAAFALLVSRPGEDHHPEILVGGFEADPEAEGETLDLGTDERLQLPALGVPLRYVARVELPVESTAGQTFVDPAPGCFVRFLGEDIGGGRVERWVTTNESGHIEESEGVLGVSLYPGDYTVTVIPAEALGGDLGDYSPFVTTSPISITGSGEIAGQVFPLSWRPLLKGAVLAAGEQVPQATLGAEPLPGSAAVPRPNSTGTGFDGLFSLWL
ncbi:MAG TPA: hypothetical protein VM285_07690, partial [Polyangia bacterium]|nr:hypothetical protein [Polyangia bacterium]